MEDEDFDDDFSFEEGLYHVSQSLDRLAFAMEVLALDVIRERNLAKDLSQCRMCGCQLVGVSLDGRDSGLRCPACRAKEFELSAVPTLKETKDEN